MSEKSTPTIVSGKAITLTPNLQAMADRSKARQEAAQKSLNVRVAENNQKREEELTVQAAAKKESERKKLQYALGGAFLVFVLAYFYGIVRAKKMGKTGKGLALYAALFAGAGAVVGSLPAAYLYWKSK